MAKPQKPFIEKLFNVRNKMKDLVKDRDNEFHNSKYYDINDILEMLNPILRREKLLLTQPVQGDRVVSIIKDVEANEKGEHEFDESWLELPKDLNPQKMGGAITYFRRYTLVSLLGMKSDDDDDGNAASGIRQNNYRPNRQTQGQKSQIKPVERPKPSVRPQQSAQQKNKDTRHRMPPPGHVRPWLDLYDPANNIVTKNYHDLVRRKENEGLTKKIVLAWYKVNKRDQQWLDRIFPNE